MGKPDRDMQRRAGKRLLAEWGIGADAGVAALREACGRNADADLAIAHRLGGLAEPASIAALVALEAATHDKLLVKEIRRALYRLQQRGLTVSQPPATATGLAVAAPALDGYLSPIDGRGDQIVWLTKARPAGIDHLYAVINDPDGLREVDLTETTRKTLRNAQKELETHNQIRMIPADWHYCDFLIERAVRWAHERHHPFHGDYRGFRARLTRDVVREVPNPVRAALPVADVARDPAALKESPALLQEPEFRTWFFTTDELRPYLDEVQQIKDSPLVLNPAQQQERFRMVVEQATEALWGGAPQASWARRMEMMAYIFHATGRTAAAKQALAVTLALEGSAHGGRDIPFCDALTRSSLVAFLQMEEQREQQEARGSLVVTPQQAARDAQRRRSGP